jgi:hypothetical protein
MRIASVCCCLIFLLVSCGSKKVPEGKVLSTDKMQAVMWDILQAEAYTDLYLKKDSSKNIFLQNAALQKKVFLLHKISKEDFYKSYDYYSNHSAEMRILLDSISVKAERNRSKMMEQKYAHPSPSPSRKLDPQR